MYVFEYIKSTCRSVLWNGRSSLMAVGYAAAVGAQQLTTRAITVVNLEKGNNNMKKYTICTLLFVTAQAFTVPFSCSVRGKVTVLRARPDTSKQVEAALEASHRYGPTSPEARIAWEAVEEMDASDNR